MDPRFSIRVETSAAQGLDHCNGCGACCREAPCLLLPDDVPRITAHLGVSREYLMGALQIERTPRGQFQVRMKNPCTFLDGNRCEIHEAKPAGGRDFQCWTDNPQTYYWSEADMRSLIS